MLPERLRVPLAAIVFGVMGGLLAAYVLWLIVHGAPPLQSGRINGWALDAFFLAAGVACVIGGRRRRPGSAVPVELDLRIGDRLPERVEVTACYIVSEALTNAAKHASATVVRVAVDSDAAGGAVRLAVRDNGVGGAEPAGGSGLVGLRDRVEAAGGTITINSPAGGGTELLVELPLRPESAAA